MSDLTQEVAQPLKGEVITNYTSYQEYKQELDQELGKAAEGFVRIGYLLKVARDTNILTDSPYDNVTDFAKAEYDLDKSQVSRFIRINDRFAEDGYSEQLDDRYRSFGYAKLSIMLTLPDEINEVLTPEFSKSEIQAVKEEVEEERKVSDIERMLEPKDQSIEQFDGIGKIIAQLGKDEPELYRAIHGIAKDENWTVEDFKEAMAPSGDKIYNVRIPGVGRQMLSIKDSEDQVQVINMRTNEKSAYKWGDIEESWIELMNSEVSPEESYEQTYGEPFPKKPKKKKKESKVVKAKTEKTRKKPESEDQSESVEQMTLHEIEESIPAPAPIEEKPDVQQADPEMEETPEEQIPGQQTIYEKPEVLPHAPVMNPPIDGENPQKERMPRHVYEEKKEEYLKACKEHIQVAQERIDNEYWRMAMSRLESAINCLEHVNNLELALEAEEADEAE